MKNEKVIFKIIMTFYACVFLSLAAGKPALSKGESGNPRYQRARAETRAIKGRERSPVEKHIIEFTGKPNKKLAEVITKAAKKYKIDPLLLSTIISLESSFKSNRTGRAGERGLTQIIPRGVCSHGQNLSTETGQANAGARCLKLCFDECKTLRRSLTMYASGHCVSKSKRTIKKIKYRVALYNKNKQKFEGSK